ncbi:hypothetical protein RI054_05g27210 [Pseudoscourfieldia marina]
MGCASSTEAAPPPPPPPKKPAAPPTKPAAEPTPPTKPAAEPTPTPKPAAEPTPAPKPAAEPTPAPKPAAEPTPAPAGPQLAIQIKYDIDQAEWQAMFDAHATNTEHPSFQGFKLPASRGQFVDESKTMVYHEVGAMKSSLIDCSGVDLMKMGALMGGPSFAALNHACGAEVSPPTMLVDMPTDGPPPSPDVIVFLEVKDFGVWHAGFTEHGTNKSIGGMEVPYSRSEVCDESRTKIYRNGNKLAVCVFDTNPTMGLLMADPAFQASIEKLGVISQTAKPRVALPPPPTGPEPPAPVLKWFDGKPMSEKVDWFVENAADDYSMAFVGEFAPPMPPLDKTKAIGIMKSLVASFPDFGFLNVGAPPASIEGNGAWGLVYSSGTHTGEPFALPNHPPVGPTGNYNKFGPTVCRVFADSTGTKLARVEFEPLKPGPSGPPAFYVANGGVLGAPPAAAPAPAPEMTNLFAVYHTFEEGKAEAWWENMTKLTPEDMGAMAAKQKSLGFVNQYFMPTAPSDSPIYCIWESEKAVTDEEFQTFIDGPDGPGPGSLINKCYRVMPGGFMPPSAFGASDAPAEVKPTTGKLFWIKHDFLEGAAAKFWEQAASMTKEAANEANASHGFYNHYFMPHGMEGPIWCVWESKEALDIDAIRAFIDGPNGPGGGVTFNNDINLIPEGMGIVPSAYFTADA